MERLILHKIFKKKYVLLCNELYEAPCSSMYLENHLDGEYDGENVVHDVEQLPFHRPRRDVGPLHGERDAIGRNKRKDDEVEPVLAGELRAPDPEPVVGAEEPEGVVAPLGGEADPPFPQRRQSGDPGGDGDSDSLRSTDPGSGVVQFCKLKTSLTD